MLVIDMQKDFLSPDGMCGRAGEDQTPLTEIVPRISSLLAVARPMGLRIIHTREGYAADLSDVHLLKRERSSIGATGPLGRFLIRGEAGHDFIEEMRPAHGERVFDKPGFGAFYRTDLETFLRDQGITHLVLTGVTTQCCVFSTLREAVDRGYWCLLLANCCAAFDPDVQAATLKIIQSENHLFGWIAESRALIEVLNSL